MASVDTDSSSVRASSDEAYDSLCAPCSTDRVDKHVSRYDLSVKTYVRERTLFFDSKVLKCKKISVKASLDRMTPCITSCTVMDNGSIRVCDWINQKIKTTGQFRGS